MKLRIKGNSIRIRLSQTEVQQFEKNNHVSDAIVFCPEPLQKLVYTLSVHEEQDFSISFLNNEIIIKVPETIATQWLDPSEISMRATVISNTAEVNLLVEKDFSCLKKRPEEDESDLFPHPDSDSAVC